MIFDIKKLNKIYQTAYEKALILGANELDAKSYANIELTKWVIQDSNKKQQKSVIEPKRDSKERLAHGVSLSTGIEDNAFKITSGIGRQTDTILFPSDKEYTYKLDCYCFNHRGGCKGEHGDIVVANRCEITSNEYDDIKNLFGWRNIPINSAGEPYLTEFYHQFNNGMVSQSYCVACRKNKSKTPKISKTKGKKPKKVDKRVKGRKNRLKVSKITESTEWTCQSPTRATKKYSCGKTAKGVKEILDVFGIQGKKITPPKGFWTTKNGKVLKALRIGLWEVKEDRYLHVRCIKCEDKRRRGHSKNWTSRNGATSSTSIIVKPSAVETPHTRSRKGGLPKIVVLAGKNNTPVNVTMDRIKWYRKTSHPLICLCEKPCIGKGKPSTNTFIYDIAGKGISKGILPTLIWKNYHSNYGNNKDYKVPNTHMKITSNGHVLICGDVPICSQFQKRKHGTGLHNNKHNLRDLNTGRFKPTKKGISATDFG